MVVVSKDEQSPICPSCHYRVIKLVAMEDNGTGRKVCVRCKRAIKKGLPIVKWEGKRVSE